MMEVRNVRSILKGDLNRELSLNKKGIINRVLSKDILKVSSGPEFTRNGID